MDDRDMCVVVATDVFTHADGSTIGYCLWDSVEIPECPDYHASDGLVRRRMFRSGFFCHTTHDDPDTTTTKIVYLVGLEASGAAARLAARLAMDKFGEVVERLCRHFRRKHLDPTTFRPRDQWRSTWETKQCRGCIKTFGSFTTRHNCVACGEVFCKACYTTERVDLPGVGITAVRICLHCLDVRGLENRTTRLSESSGSTEKSSRQRHAGSRAASNAVAYATMLPPAKDDRELLMRSQASTSASSLASSSVRLTSHQ